MKFLSFLLSFTLSFTLIMTPVQNALAVRSDRSEFALDGGGGGGGPSGAGGIPISVPAVPPVEDPTPQSEGTDYSDFQNGTTQEGRTGHSQTSEPPEPTVTNPETEFTSSANEITNYNEVNSTDNARVGTGTYSYAYLEMLMMISFAIISVIAPFSVRTARSKNDCAANFAGPVTTLILKAMGITYLVSEIRAKEEYDSNAEEIEKILAGLKSDTVTTQRNEAENLNYVKMYETYKKLLADQRRVYQKKIQSYRMIENYLELARTIEITTQVVCGIVCNGRHGLYIAATNSLRTASATYLTALEAQVVGMISPAPTYVAVQSAFRAYQAAVLNFYASVNTTQAYNQSRATEYSIRSRTKVLYEWGKLALDWAKAMVYADIPNFNFFTEAKIIAERTQEEVEMANNDLAISGSLTTLTALAATVEATGVFLQASMTAHQAATTACASCPIACTPCQVALPTVNLSIASNSGLIATSMSTMEAFKSAVLSGASRAIDVTENTFSNYLSGTVSLYENVVSSAGGEPSAAIDRVMAENARKLVEEATAQATAQAATSAGTGWGAIERAYIAIMMGKHTCCGSGGRVSGVPNNLMPIPAMPGSLPFATDLEPSSTLFGVIGGAFSMNDTKKVLEAVVQNINVEESYSIQLDRLETYGVNQHDFQIFLAQLDGIHKARKQKEIHIKKSELDSFLIALASKFGVPNAQASLTTQFQEFAEPLNLISVGLAIRYMNLLQKIYAFAIRTPVKRLAFVTLLDEFTERLRERAEEALQRLEHRERVINDRIALIQGQYSGGPAVESVVQEGINPDFSDAGLGDNGELAETSRSHCVRVNNGSASLAPCPVETSLSSLSTSELSELSQNFPDFGAAYRSLAGNTARLASDSNSTNSVFSNSNLDKIDREISALKKKYSGAEKKYNDLYKDNDGGSILNKVISDAKESFQNVINSNDKNSLIDKNKDDSKVANAKVPEFDRKDGSDKKGPSGAEKGLGSLNFSLGRDFSTKPYDGMNSDTIFNKNDSYYGDEQVGEISAGLLSKRDVADQRKDLNPRDVPWGADIGGGEFDNLFKIVSDKYQEQTSKSLKRSTFIEK